ncbi:MAG: PEGA domain-containing protein [Myxococcota bacterium]
MAGDAVAGDLAAWGPNRYVGAHRAFAALLVGGLSALTTPGGARAQTASPPTTASPSAPAAASETTRSATEAPTTTFADSDRARARRAFVRGTELAAGARWGQALAAFETAAQIKPHPVTTYNIGTCLRAIGAYTRARSAFLRALAQNGTATSAPPTSSPSPSAPTEDRLPPELKQQAETFIGEIEALLVRVVLTVTPASARLTVDGRPLLREGADHYAGVRPAGQGEPTPPSPAVVWLDPGAHVFTFTRPGFAAAVRNETFAAAARRDLRVALDRLPARLFVSATVPDALVTLGGRDLGPAPLSVARPAGRYPLLVEHDGYEPFRSTLTLGPGEQARVEARLEPADTSVFETWWFWTAAAATVAGAATATYFIVRPDPEPPPFDGGSTGWVVQGGFPF